MATVTIYNKIKSEKTARAQEFVIFIFEKEGKTFTKTYESSDNKALENRFNRDYPNASVLGKKVFNGCTVTIYATQLGQKYVQA